MHLAPQGATKCDYGISVPQSKCGAAVHHFARIAGQIPARSLQVGSGGSCLDGSWGQVPLGCSAQSGGDWSAHYKTGGVDHNEGCIHELYQLVCYDANKGTIYCHNYHANKILIKKSLHCLI